LGLRPLKTDSQFIGNSKQAGDRSVSQGDRTVVARSPDRATAADRQVSRTYSERP